MAEPTVSTTTSEEVPASATREESRYQVPPVDIFESQDGLTVLADLPGVSKEDVTIRVEENTLTIQGKTTSDARGDSVYTEYALHDFYRQFKLNDEVDQERIGAEMKNGVLTLQLPKREEVKPKQIKVNVS